jgi:hypothetical protein
MAIESAVMFRRVARSLSSVLIVGLLFMGAAPAQLPIKAPVPVTVGSVVPFGHGSTGVWGQIYSMALAPNGNLLFLDSALSNIYQLAPGATVPTLVVGPSANSSTASNGSTLESAGSYWNAAVAVDANNVLYITDRYGSSVHFFRVPYDAASGTWVFSTASNWTNSPSITSNGTSTAITPQFLTIGDDGTFYVTWSDTGEIDKFTVSSSGTPGPVTRIITGLLAYASQVSVDHAGNVFFIEDATGGSSSRVNGVMEIPANATLPITGNADGVIEQSLIQVIPTSAGFEGIKGLTFDKAGNLFVTSEDNSGEGGYFSGVLMIPNEGTPTAPNLNWSDTVMVSPVSAQFPVLVDPRGFLWIPTGGSTNWTTPGTVNTACSSTDVPACTASSVVLWAMGSANLGASPVGTVGAAQTLYYSFSQPITPGSFVYAGSASKSFTTITTNPSPDTTLAQPVLPCTAGTAYPAFASQETTNAEYSWCTFWVGLDALTAGNVAGELEMLDSNGKIIAGSNAYLSGTGQAPAASILSSVVTGAGGGGALAQIIASGLNQPQQVAADPAGDTFVADSALKAIEMYSAGSASSTGTGVSGKSIGTGLTAPTGVAVDGAGDLYIGDSGDIIEIPFINSALATSQQTTLLTGLGDHLNLAADASGNVFVADKDKKQVVKISNPQVALMLADEPINTLGAGVGFTGPSAIATDDSGDVWVADGSNLWELTPFGAANEILSSLTAPVTGLAVDPSGSVFVVEAGKLVWIPYEASSGGLSVNGAVEVGTLPALATAPFSVALDGLQNSYISYGSGATAGLSQLGTAGSINYGQIVPFAESDAEAEIVNLGNRPMTLSAFAGDVFTGPNAGDYAVGTPNDTPACAASTPILPGGLCYFDVALTPSAAGLSSASVPILSNAANAPSINLALQANAVADLRPATTTAVVVTPATGVVYPGNVTITVTVNAGSSGTPGGTVKLSVAGTQNTQDLNSSGVAAFTFNNLLGGTYTAVADYGGEGVVGTAPDFAASGGKTTFTVNPATPVLNVSAPAGSSGNLTVWAGNTYLSVATSNTITASVTSSVGTPSGTVTFNLPNGQPADPTQVALPLLANGTAVFSTTNLAQGVYNLTAVYSGDVNFASVNTALPAFEVIAPSVQVTANPDTVTITPGTPAQATLTLEPLVGFSDYVDVECVTATLPAYSECTFSNPEIDVANGTASTIVVTISTNVPVNGGATGSVARPEPWSLAGVFGLGLLGLIAGRRRFHRYLTMICLAVMLSGAFMAITSCTNAGYSTPPPAPVVKTPSGTYQVQVITVNPSTGNQNSLTTPLFTLATTVN